MNKEELLWIVFGHPPSQKAVEIISVLDPEKTSTERGAIKEGISQNRDRDYRNWDFAAVLLKRGQVNSTKRKLARAFREFGVPDSEISNLIQGFAREISEVLRKNLQKKHIYN